VLFQNKVNQMQPKGTYWSSLFISILFQETALFLQNVHVVREVKGPGACFSKTPETFWVCKAIFS